jgi:hypothetical protein
MFLGDFPTALTPSSNSASAATRGPSLGNPQSPERSPEPKFKSDKIGEAGQTVAGKDAIAGRPPTRASEACDGRRVRTPHRLNRRSALLQMRVCAATEDQTVDVVSGTRLLEAKILDLTSRDWTTP